MKALFHFTLNFGKVAHFSWMAGWGVWLLAVTFTVFLGGSIFVPVLGGFLTFSYGNFLLGLAMVFLGLPIGLSIAHFSSVLMRIPLALFATWLSTKPGLEAERARLNQLGRSF